MNIVFGIDPDAQAHGVAEYHDGNLISLDVLELVELVNRANAKRGDGHSVSFSIENVLINKFVYGRNEVFKRAVQSNIAMKIGRCQQAQVELMRVLDHYELPYVLHKPQKGNWADKRELFERVTGWKGRSNPDTRAAAYFGYLAINQLARNSRPSSVKPLAITASK